MPYRGCMHCARTEGVDEGAVVAAGGGQGPLLEERVRQCCPRPDSRAADLYTHDECTLLPMLLCFYMTAWTPRS
jgi:hypothetical protein